jgi:glycosyltransferase involved in cell wall biosynthesis
VITVCFNNASTIADTLRSVSQQSWPYFEHILVDGASSDGTQAVVQDHMGPRTQFISEIDRGIYDAMNKGVARSKCNVICFLNADDFYASNDVLEKVARLMAAHNLDALFGDVSYFHPKNPQKVLRRYDSGQFSPAKLRSGWMPAHPAMFVRRAVFDDVGPFRTDFSIAGDFEWTARAFRDGHLRYRHLPQVLVRMRVGGVSTRGIMSTIIVNREILRACRENGIRTNVFKLLEKFPRKLMERFRK